MEVTDHPEAEKKEEIYQRCRRIVKSSRVNSLVHTEKKKRLHVRTQKGLDVHGRQQGG